MDGEQGGVTARAPYPKGQCWLDFEDSGSYPKFNPALAFGR